MRFHDAEGCIERVGRDHRIEAEEKRVTGSRETDLLAGAAVRGLGVHERELIFEELFARRVVPVRRLGRGPCRGWGEDLHRNRHS